MKKNKIFRQNNVYVIGHAYGSHSEINSLSNSVLNFFKSLTIDNQILILTGDIVRESSLENLESVQNQISYFDLYSCVMILMREDQIIFIKFLVQT